MTLMVSKASLALEVFDTEAAVVVVSIANSEPHRCCTTASRFSALAWTVFWRQMMLKVSMACLEAEVFDTVAAEFLASLGLGLQVFDTLVAVPAVSLLLQVFGTLAAAGLGASFVFEVFDTVAVVVVALTRPAPHCPPQSTTSS